MGRQAHITRLTLGRSPYGPPLRDENGEFILGSHVHINDAPGYRQEFDDRGHPQNRASLAAARRLRKAQNDVLATVGVVVKKGEDRKSKWEKLDDNQKWDIIHDENFRGEQGRIGDRIAGVMIPWYFVSLRRRFMTLEPYFILPTTSLVVKEYRLLGPISMSFAGLPMHLLSSIPQLFRYCSDDTNVEGIVNYIDPWRGTQHNRSTVSESLTWLASTATALCIELPLSLHAILQSLHMIPATVIMSWRSLLPFSAASPISIPILPENFTYQTLYTFVTSLIQSPLCLYLVRDQLHQEVGYRIYALLRQILTKPDRPDRMSAKVSDEADNMDDTMIAGIGYPWPGNESEFERHKRYFGPKSFWGAFRLAFPPIYNLLNVLSRGRIGASRGNLSPELDHHLRAAAREGHRLARVDFEEHSIPDSTETISFQRNIVCSVFRFANLLPSEELVDPVAWAHDTLGPSIDNQRNQSRDARNPSETSVRFPRPIGLRNRASNDRPQDDVVNSVLTEAFTAMRSNDAVVIQASDDQAVILVQPESDDPPNVAARQNVHTIDAAQVPLDALLQGVSDIVPDMQLTEPREPRSQRQRAEAEASTSRPHQSPSPPPTPTPGISRAVSLTDPQIENPSSTNLRPLRRPTETDDSLAAISQTLRAEAENFPSPRPSPPLSPVTERPHRMATQPAEDGAISTLTFTKHRLYRVTMLSNHVADSLAWHASAMITSLVLWPFEAMYLRAVANWALQNPAMGSVIDPWWAARLGFGVVGTPVNVFGLGTWFGGASDAGGRLRYVSGILLTLGVEGLVRGACWRVGLWWVKRCKDEYGWGRF